MPKTTDGVPDYTKHPTFYLGVPPGEVRLIEKVRIDFYPNGNTRTLITLKDGDDAH